MRSARPPDAVDSPLRTDENPWSAHHQLSMFTCTGLSTFRRTPTADERERCGPPAQVSATPARGQTLTQVASGQKGRRARYKGQQRSTGVAGGCIRAR